MQEVGREYVGKTGTVVEVGTEGALDLRVELSGTTWRALDSSGATLSVGDAVRIVRMEGLTLIVETEGTKNDP
jgi:membrane-bound serine protease (ClpP class)